MPLIIVPVWLLAVSLTAGLARAAPGNAPAWSPTYSHTPSATSPTASSTVAATLDGQLPAYTPANFQFSGNVRNYYVAAEEVEWDYAPTGWDNWLGVPFNQSPRAQMAEYTQMGTKWLKALYRGYTDSSFRTLTSQPPYQGTQGPTLRGEVGDMIEIMFCNKLSKNYASMHSMGLTYGKANEGGDYPNNTMPGQNSPFTENMAVPPFAGVEPGSCVVYKWLVTWIMGPAPGTNGPAKVHSYHSYVSMYEDLNAGLIGPTIIYAPGMMNSTMSGYREIPLLYMIYDEAVSWLGSENKAMLSGSSNTSAMSTIPDLNPAGNHSIWYSQSVNVLSGSSFSSAPSFHTMNGYVFANNPTFDMCQGDKVIWYVSAYGSASHVFHMHGHDFEYDGAGQYAVSINDGVGKTLYMNATGTGIWEVLCHVSNHLSKGMVANYRVYPTGQCPLPALS